MLGVAEDKLGCGWKCDCSCDCGEVECGGGGGGGECWLNVEVLDCVGVGVTGPRARR